MASTKVLLGGSTIVKYGSQAIANLENCELKIDIPFNDFQTFDSSKWVQSRPGTPSGELTFSGIVVRNNSTGDFQMLLNQIVGNVDSSLSFTLQDTDASTFITFGGYFGPLGWQSGGKGDLQKWNGMVKIISPLSITNN